jgi:hypothetical protein
VKGEDMNEILDDVEPMADGSVREWWILPNGDVRIVTKFRGEKMGEKILKKEGN